jgi:hypothetical protein
MIEDQPLWGYRCQFSGQLEGEALESVQLSLSEDASVGNVNVYSLEASQAHPAQTVAELTIHGLSSQLAERAACRVLSPRFESSRLVRVEPLTPQGALRIFGQPNVQQPIIEDGFSGMMEGATL